MNINIIVPILSAVGCFFLGTLVFIKNRNTRVNQYFGFLLIMGGLWALSGFFKYQAIINNLAVGFPVIWDIELTVMCGLGLVLFSWYFPVKNENLKPTWFYYYGFLTVLVSALGFMGAFTSKVEIKDGLYLISYTSYFKIIYLPYFISSIIYSLVNISVKYKRIENYFEKQRVKYLYFGYMIGFIIGNLANNILPLLGYERFSIIGSFAPFLGNLPVAYAIARYRLMEVDTVIHKTLLWLMSLLLLVLPVAFINDNLRFFAVKINTLEFIFLNTLFLLIFIKYYNGLKPFIDRFFRRRKYDYFKHFNQIIQKVGSELDLQKLARKFMLEIEETLCIRNGFLLVRHKEAYFEVIGDFGYDKLPSADKPKTLVIASNNHLLMELQRTKKTLEKQEVEINPDYEKYRSELIKLMERYQVELFVPFVLGDQVNALLGLGKTETLRNLTLNDIEFLENIGRQLSISLDNAVHHEDIVEKERMDEELKLGREMQESLLPKVVPETEGLKVEGLMVPAKEIGGDYYDYIVTSHKVVEAQQGESAGDKVLRESSDTIPLYHSTTDRLAIVIGDVSGKGVAAGLIMATAKATLKGLSEQGLTPKETLTRTNHMLYEYTKGEKFMTMLYLEWDNQQKRLNYSSAGHEHIIIYRSGKVVEAQQGEPAGDKVVKQIENSTTLPLYHSITGSVEVIKSGGFALGIMEAIGPMLENRSLHLDTGDKVVLYTDGVTDAHNEKNELYSLERLKDTVGRHGYKPAKELISGIKQEVYDFIGTAAQYDDITLLVIEKK